MNESIKFAEWLQYDGWNIFDKDLQRWCRSIKNMGNTTYGEYVKKYTRTSKELYKKFKEEYENRLSKKVGD